MISYDLCVKTGMRPMFSTHPNLTKDIVSAIRNEGGELMKLLRIIIVQWV